MNDGEACGLLERMVRTRSLSGRERPLAELLVREMASSGLRAWIDEAGNAVGVRGEGPSDIVLLGHMDTVPGEVPVRIEGGRLYGRGAVDAKGPLAGFVAAAARVAPPAGVRVVVIGAVEEEAASSRGARHAASRWRPAACVIGEPSGWDGVTLGYKGRLVAELRVGVSPSHSAGPRPTAPELACEWWRRVRRDAEGITPDARGVFDRVQARLRSIGSGGNGLRDEASASVSFRLPSGVEPRELAAISRRAAAEIIGELGADDAEIGVSCSGHERAWVTPRESPIVRAFTAAVRDSGGTPRLKHKTGTSDMNVVGPAWGCPIVAYGPGDSSLDHTPDESIELSEFCRGIGVLTSAVSRVAAELAEGTFNTTEAPGGSTAAA